MRLLATFLIIMLTALSSITAQAQKKTLTIYTYSSFTSEWGPGPSIAKEFEKKCDCNLRYISFNDGVSLLTRMKLENKNTEADIVLGLDNNLIAEARITGLFAPHGMKDNDLQKLSLPFQWEDAFFLPYDYGWFAFIYNKNKLPNPPQSFDELQKSKLKLLVQDPRTSTPGLGLLLWVRQIYGKDDSKVWKNLNKNILSYSTSWEEAYGLFLKGEGDMVLSYTTSPAYHAVVEKNSAYQAAVFDEGHYIQIEVAGKIKHSDQQELADEFLKFMLTKNFQKHIPTNNWMYPVIDGINLPKQFESLPQPQTTLFFDSDETAQNRSAWTRKWLLAK